METSSYETAKETAATHKPRYRCEGYVCKGSITRTESECWLAVLMGRGNRKQGMYYRDFNAVWSQPIVLHPGERVGGKKNYGPRCSFIVLVVPELGSEVEADVAMLKGEFDEQGELLVHLERHLFCQRRCLGEV